MRKIIEVRGVEIEASKSFHNDKWEAQTPLENLNEILEIVQEKYNIIQVVDYSVMNAMFNHDRKIIVKLLVEEKL